ncbi:hypothetical protein GCM10017620_16400 [Brevundimonas intermedia]|uniref:Uncharacterized protein n=1 Tax=Brevundimonas intermedia TaxID=74315 RepID=A0ABQ5T7B0_9CAUL|nr:hypothetical protein [Brevundimonas intermedia]GLK48667.1 hypothetical protein GCM10017620_16400 [Brevundimonas intermedia]
MINGIGLQDRIGALGGGVVETLSHAGRWIVSQTASTIDRPRWRAATSMQERAKAVSWPRAAALVGLFLAAVMAILFASGVFRHQPGPAPLPTERELRIRSEALANFTPSPPRGLVEANTSASTPSSAGRAR